MDDEKTPAVSEVELIDEHVAKNPPINEEDEVLDDGERTRRS